MAVSAVVPAFVAKGVEMAALTVNSRAQHDLIAVNGRPWTLGSVRGRTKKCECCRESLESGEKAYRPLCEGAGVAGHMRLCQTCVAKQLNETMKICANPECGEPWWLHTGDLAPAIEGAGTPMCLCADKITGMRLWKETWRVSDGSAMARIVGRNMKVTINGVAPITFIQPPRWDHTDIGWYTHSAYGAVVFETTISARQTGADGRRRGWWWYGHRETWGPFPTATEARQAAEDWGP